MRTFIVILMLGICSSLMQAQDSRFDSLIASGIHDIYAMKHQSAEASFRQLMADYPQHPAGRFYLAMIDWWKILVDLDNEDYDDIFFQKLEDVIFLCDKILEKDPDNVDALFFKGGAIGFRGRLHANRESWLKAADDGREALPIVERAAKLAPGNKDVELGFGIYNYYAAVIPDDFPLVKPLMVFFPKGDKEQGLKQLQETATQGKYARIEAKYFLLTLFYSYEKNVSRAKDYAEELYAMFPENPVFERWRGRIAVRLGETQTYMEIFSKVYEKYQKKSNGYNLKSAREAVYYLGYYYKMIGVADSSRGYFEKAVEYSVKMNEKSETGFLCKSLLYAGMMNDAVGNREKALEYYERTLKARDYDNSHSSAKNFINQPYKM